MESEQSNIDKFRFCQVKLYKAKQAIANNVK